MPAGSGDRTPVHQKFPVTGKRPRRRVSRPTNGCRPWYSRRKATGPPRAGVAPALARPARLHAGAVNDSIVTPLSSMIVLVNAPQELLLDKLEAQDDRFQREHEDVGETIAAPPVAAVPEPEEWLLISLMAGLLVWYGRSKRRETRLDAAVQ